MKISNIHRNILFIMSCLTAFVLAVQVVVCCAQAQVSASVDTAQISIGDIIHYKVLINIPDDAQLKDPFTAEGMLGDFEIRDFKWSVEKEENQQFVLQYSLSIFKTGKHNIPEYNIKYRVSDEDAWQASRAQAIEITVNSVLQDAKTAALKPLKPRLIIWRDFLPWLIACFVIAAAIWVGIKVWGLKHKTLEKAVIVEAAHIIAYRELDIIDRENLLARGLMEKYYEKLSGCLRRYLENRFSLKAPLMSTEEFLQAVKASPILSTAQRVSLKEFLKLADLVKFACYGSSNKEAGEAFQEAKNFIDQTKQADSVEEKHKS